MFIKLTTFYKFRILSTCKNKLETAKGMDLLNHMLLGRLQAEQVRLVMIEVQHEQHGDYADYLYARDRVIQELFVASVSR
jgi:hypothetical protein